MSDWNERFAKASQIMDKFNNSIDSNKSSRFQTAEIEFGDDTVPIEQKSSPIKKLYDFFGTKEPPNAGRDVPNVPQIKTAENRTPEKKSKMYSYDLDDLEGGILMSCKIEDWSKGFTLFGDFIRDAKKYYKKTCVNANYIYFFSYRPMYRELSHEQLCWYLFWRSAIRNGTYPKTGLSYIFLYLYEQINLSDIIGHEKVYANIIKIWKNYRSEFPRIDKYIAEWLIDFSLINKLKIDLQDIEEILPHIINIVTIPEVYLREDFFKNNNNTDFIIKNMAMHDYKKSKFYNEKNQELFDYHITRMVHEVLSSAEFEEIIKSETEDGVRIKNTRESFMGAVCIYDHKKRITVEYKILYKNFFIRQCITDSVRYAENALRDYLNIKSKLTVVKFPGQLKKVIDEYKSKYLAIVKAPKISIKNKNKKKDEHEEIPEIIEFNPNIEAAAEIEKSSWDTTMTLVELQERDNNIVGDVVLDAPPDEEIEIEIDDDGEFIAIDTGIDETYKELEEIAPVEDAVLSVPQSEPDEDIFDILENLENQDGRDELRSSAETEPTSAEEESAEPEFTDVADMKKFIASLNEEEYTALELLLGAKSENKNFDILCGKFLSRYGKMLESVVDTINEKAMDFTGDIIFDTAMQEIIEDYRDDIEECLKNG